LKTIQLREADCLPDEEADALAGRFLDEKHYILLAGAEDLRVLKPDGSPLLVFRRQCLPAAACRAAFPALRGAAGLSFNRGYAAGDVLSEEDARSAGNGRQSFLKGKVAGKRVRPLKKDGTLSNTDYAKPVESGIVGYFDRNPRFPYCRTTAYNLDHPDRFAAALPFFAAVNEVFRREMPDRWAAQMEKVRATARDFVISGTAFTTVTVNKNWRTAVHKDAGDLREGFGVMSALRAGHYSGCYLVFPKYRVAADMRTRDVLLADVHEWHGNTPLVGVEGAYERLSTVLYYREKMVHCGSAAEELERAANRRPGDKIHG
jgi:hypothetical protein